MDIYATQPHISEDELQLRLAQLESMSPAELRAEFERVWGEKSYSHCTSNLRNRIAWRLRCLCYGGLSGRAIRKAEELADVTKMRDRVPFTHNKCSTKKEVIRLNSQDTPECELKPKTPESRMRRPGAFLRKFFDGREHVVYALADKRFAYQGQFFSNLTAVAKLIAGYKVSGNRFFSTNTTFSDK